MEKPISERQHGCPLKKAQCMERYYHLMDCRNIHPPWDKAASEWLAYGRKFAARTTLQEIKSFYANTTHLRWPENDGQTPWEYAAAVGWLATHPGETEAYPDTRWAASRRLVLEILGEH